MKIDSAPPNFMRAPVYNLCIIFAQYVPLWLRRRKGEAKRSLCSRKPKEKADSHSTPVLVTRRDDDFLAVCNVLAADAQHVA
jgi:hypothetical protein